MGNNYFECSFFVGILALLLALSASLWRRDRVVWTLWLLTGVAIAAALGTPVLAGDCPALRETLGDAARFCDPTDPLAIQRRAPTRLSIMLLGMPKIT